MRLLVVEDQKKTASFLKKGLTESGYIVDVAETGESAEMMVAGVSYDLIILDIMLPDQNGLDTARHLRRDGFKAPVLMLTALGGTQDKVKGLDAGADDYLSKPFSFDELLARIRAILRRSQGDAISQLRFETLEMDLVKRIVKREGQTISLTAKEFSLLELFMQNPSRPLSRTTIAEKVWDIHFDSESNVIDVYINLLRKKVDVPFKTRLIHTLVGVGYVMKDERS